MAWLGLYPSVWLANRYVTISLKTKQMKAKNALKKKKMRRIVIGNTHHLPPSPEEIVHFCKFRHFCQRGKQQPQSCSIPEYQTPPPRNSTNLPCADKLEVAFRHPRDAPRNRDSLPCYLEIL